MFDANQEVIQEFLVESLENLTRLDQEMVELEKRPGDRELLASVFRTIHTIKGTCGFLNFPRLESLTHGGESLLSRLRDGRLQLTPDITGALLQMVDVTRQMLASIETTGTEGDTDFTALLERLHQFQATPQATPADNARPPHPTPRPTASIPVPTEPPVGEREPEEVPVAPSPSAGRPRLADNHIRVDVNLLDKLMNLVGELVLARNQILQFTATQEDAGFLATSQRLNLITTELQEGVMKTRMQPIGNIWGKFPRLVRDMAVSCGKQVRIEMVGKETELDKTILEAIKDPLIHIIRNCIDHGIEAPKVRSERGKPQEGCLFLRAFHEGGQVNIEITDDGGGVDLERVKSKALQRGLISLEQAGRMTERELINLIFLPGFSTAEQVTNVSGRGVGMDVVKTNIEKIGGQVDLHNRMGAGTTLKIKIPLTLAIIPALMVTGGGDRYAIPQVSLLELVRLQGEAALHGIETVHGTPLYRLRGNLLPLVYLNRTLRIDSRAEGSQEAINIVVLQADDRQFGLIVDEINDTEEIVVKPLGKQLKGIPGFAGATILGDGKVALILDVMGIAQQAAVITGTRERSRSEKLLASESSEPAQSLLLFRIGTTTRSAIPLSLVSRLEEIPRTSVERAGGHDVVQYRGQIMPLVYLSQALGLPPAMSSETMLSVIVYAETGQSIGLVVDRILDIVEEHITIQRRFHHAGYLGSAVIQGSVTDLVDVPGIIRRTVPMFLEAA